MILVADVNGEALLIFGIVLAITLGITYWASKRAQGTVGFYAAGRQITGAQNGLAISGDYLSAASFLGIAGLIFLFGFDGFLYSIGFLVAFLTVMFLLAERMRNAGKFTIADVLAFRLRERPARTAAALGTLAVVAFYLIAQMVGAGVLIEKLVGINFSLAVVLTGAFMLCYVVFGGMVATTWVQIIKACLLMAGIVVVSIFVLGKVGFNRDRAVQQGRRQQGAGVDVLARPGHVPAEADRHRVARPRARARHRRPAAHLDAVLHRAERQGGAQLGRVGDVHHRVLLPADDVHRLRRTGVPREEGVEAAGTAGNLAAPNLAAFLGGGEGTFGGDLFLAVIAGVAFAVAASANFPALLLALTWRRFNTAGAVTGVLFGVVSSIALVIVSPKVWPGADTVTGSPVGWERANPGIVSIPLGFLGCWLGTVLSREHGAERTYQELFVRSETGLGAEKAVAGR